MTDVYIQSILDTALNFQSKYLQKGENNIVYTVKYPPHKKLYGRELIQFTKWTQISTENVCFNLSKFMFAKILVPNERKEYIFRQIIYNNNKENHI